MYKQNFGIPLASKDGMTDSLGFTLSKDLPLAQIKGTACTKRVFLPQEE